MKLKKRKKRSRLRGARTCGWGFRKKHKGHGEKGGFGMAGTGKRAKHKKLKALLIAREAGFESYFGKRGYTSAPRKKEKNKVINLRDIAKNYGTSGKIDLNEYKILGEGEGFKAEIIAKEASKSAIEKMEKAGGKIVFNNS
ncbi:MAG: uL15 family ribosomal protein [Candidatus Pacearchaeota archaeon]